MNSFVKFFKDLSFGKAFSIMLTPIITTMFSLKVALIGLILLVTIDFITGVRKSLLNKKVPLNPFKAVFYKNIKSDLIRNTWRKFYEYGLGIIVIIILDSYFGHKITVPFINASLSETAIILAAVIEVYSIFENLRDTNKKIKFIEVLIELIDSLIDLFPESLKKALKKK